MQERHVDARGLECPQPVVLARQAILEAGSGIVRVLVDNPVNAENIERMAKGLGWEASVEQAGTQIQLTLVREKEAEASAAACAEAPAAKQAAARLVVLVASHVIGSGDEQLGRILMRAFLKTLQDLTPAPAALIFINAGVWLTTAGSEVLDDLRALESRSVRILSCGTCLDYYRRLDALRVGAVSNMYEIVTALMEADRILRP